MKKLLALLPILFLFACKQSVTKQVDTIKINPTIYSIGNGNKVIFLCDYYDDYLKAIKAGYKNHDSLYRMKIQDPICNRYFSKCEYSEFISYAEFSNPIQDTVGLENRISYIDSNKEKIEKILSDAFINCHKYLRDDSITIYIQPSEGGLMGKVIKRMGGIAGFTGGSKQILLTIQPEVSTWSDMLADALAHEYHHACWTEKYYNTQPSRDVLFDMVFEGRADSYAHILYPNIITAWDTILSAQQKIDFWNKIKPDIHNTDMSLYPKVMFGGRDGYPIWGGYCLGFDIVQSALKNHPELAPKEWTKMSPEKILEMSDYK